MSSAVHVSCRWSHLLVLDAEAEHVVAVGVGAGRGGDARKNPKALNMSGWRRGRSSWH